MKASKNYTEIAEELNKEYSDILVKAHKECLNILRENECRIDIQKDDVDYDVVITDYPIKKCSLRGVYLQSEGSENIYLSLYCYDNKHMYETSMLNTDLQPTTLLTTLAAKVCDEFHIEDYLYRYTYQLDVIEGKKVIHIDGYVYWNDGHYDLVQACGCYIPVSDLDGQSEEEVNDYIDTVFCEAKQYQGEITEEEIQGYYDPKKTKPFPFYHITEETPCGFYVA